MVPFQITGRKWSFPWIGKSVDCLHNVLATFYHYARMTSTLPLNTPVLQRPSYLMTASSDLHPTRYFSKMPASRPIQRGSWGLELDRPLFMPPGDPHETHRNHQIADLPLSRVHLRTDWQTLRRLPLSGAIVFNFKALFTPIEEFRDEAYIPALVAKVLREGKRNLMEYKNTWHVQHVALPALDRWAEEQEEMGLVEKGWEVRTLDESPWFPGWEDKWHRQQGF